MRDRLIYAVLGGFIVAVFARSFFNFGWAFSVFTLLLAGAVYAYARVAYPEAFRRVGLVLVALCLLGGSLGLLRFDVSDLKRGDPKLEPLIGQAVTLRGVVSEEPDERETNERLTVDLKSLKQDTGEEVSVGGRTLVTTEFYPVFHYGDEVVLRGVLKKPENFSTDAELRPFDYISYLAKDGIFYVMNKPRVSFLSSGKGNVVKENLFALKEKFLGITGAVIPEPHQSLLGGLLVGAKHSLGQNLLDDFRKAGVIHIVVLSGYNITIVAEAVMKFFSFLPRFLGMGFGSLSIILFAIMTGGSATVVRASIMALLVILARATGRDYRITRALMLAGFIMVLQNPKILVFDSSFQLSFMSTLALIYVSPMLERYFGFVPEKFGLRSIVTATTATQLFVLPMLLYKMGMLSIVALPVNLLILSFIPATMFLGFLTGVFGFVALPIAAPLGFATYLLLAYELLVVRVFSNLPFAALSIPYFPLWLAVLWYAVYGILIAGFQLLETGRRTFALAKRKAAPPSAAAAGGAADGVPY